MDPAVEIPSKKAKVGSDEEQIPTTDWSKCMFCQISRNTTPLRQLSTHGCDRISAAIKQRTEAGDKKLLHITSRLRDVQLVQVDHAIFYHKLCYDEYAKVLYSSATTSSSKRKLSQTAQSSVTEPACSETEHPRHSSRRSIPSLDKELCIFCQSKKSRRSEASTLRLVMTLELSTAILSAAQGDFVMRCRLAGIADLVAADAKYHVQCKIEFDRKMEKAKTDTQPSTRDVCFTKLTEEIRQGVECGHIYTTLDVWNRYDQLLSQFGEKAGIYRDYKTRFKQRIEKELHDIIDFVPQLDQRAPQLLFPKLSAKKVIPAFKSKHDELVETLHIQDLAHCTPKVQEDNDFVKSMFHFAMSMRAEIRSARGADSCTSVNEDAAMDVVPENLYLFLHLLLTGCEYIPDDPVGNDSNVRKKVLSIAQDLVYIISSGRKLTPKHIGLGMTLHQATRSKDLVNLVHAAGHCISYEQVRRIDTTIAKQALQEFEANDNVSIPVGIKPNHFFQFSADNIDIIEETLSGKGTFHATQMVAFQRGEPDNVLPAIPIGKDRTVKVPDALHQIVEAPRQESRPVPKFREEVHVDWFRRADPTDMDARASDLTWSISRLSNSDNQTIPFWTGFNQLVSSVSPSLCSVGYLPILNFPAHEYDTLWTIITRCHKISSLLNPGQSTVLTLDEQLYCKAKELQWANEDACQNLVLRLGGFHTALNFMKAIGKHFADSGLTDVWTESSVFSETTAMNIMSVGSYNRAVRAHKLTYDALLTILWPQFTEWLIERQSALSDEITDAVRKFSNMIKDREDTDEVLSAYTSLKESVVSHQIVDLLSDFQSSRPPTVLYWQQYIDMVSLLLRFIRAEREGNWPLHLSSFTSMLPWFSVYDHVNYTRWGTVYLADMRQLEFTHPDVYEQFMAGDFVVKRTNQKFNQLSTDQALEHINKVSKTAGGLIGISREDSARDRWCLTFNQRSQLVADTYDMLGSHDNDEDLSAWESKETRPARLARDEEDVCKIMEQFNRFGVFSHSAPHILCLSTKDVAPDDVTKALLSAFERGQEQVNKFVHQRLCEQSSQFYGTLSKNNSPTLASMYNIPVKNPSVDKMQIVKGGRTLFQRLVVAQEAGRDIKLEDILCHELSKTPLAIAEANGNLYLPTNKADLSHILADSVTSSSLPQSDLKTDSVIDGQSLVMALGKPTNANTFGDLADAFITAVRNKPGDRVDVVFDRYFQDSIKGATRTKRVSGVKKRPIRRIIESRDVPLPANWGQFMGMSDNKANLEDFLSNELMSAVLSEGREIVTSGGFNDIYKAQSSRGRDVAVLSADHEEADTRIILHGLEACRQGFERLVIFCRDTDVLMLLVHFSDMLSKEVWLSSGTAKCPKYIAVHNVELPHHLRRNLPAYHALTGCDTVSQFRGYAKKLTWETFKSNTNLLDSLGVGCLTNQIKESVEAFVCKIYSPSTNIITADSLRCRLFRKGHVELEKLPPTTDALQLHIKRAHFQTKVWRLASVPKQHMESPLNHGWQKEAGDETLIPILATIDPLPQRCLEIISCNCKSCASAKCGCRKSGLICLPSCACADTVCHNPFNVSA